jgi:hypothetical protein
VGCTTQWCSVGAGHAALWYCSCGYTALTIPSVGGCFDRARPYNLVIALALVAAIGFLATCLLLLFESLLVRLPRPASTHAHGSACGCCCPQRGSHLAAMRCVRELSGLLGVRSVGGVCLVQGPFSVALCQTRIVRFASNKSLYGGRARTAQPPS